MTDTAPPYRPRIPRFTPVPVRSRSDGWTPLRQAEFIGMLAETRSVAAAARFVGMARETAYRLRRKPGAEGFAAAWDAALGHPPRPQPRRGSRKVTPAHSWRAVVDGRWRVIVWDGKYCGSVCEPHDSALLGFLRQLDRSLQEEGRAIRRKARSGARSQPKTTRSAFHDRDILSD